MTENPYSAPRIDRQPIAKQNLWKFVPMKINGVIILLIGLALTIGVIDSIAQKDWQIWIPLIPIGVLIMGFYIFRCSKTGLICTCVTALFFLTIAVAMCLSPDPTTNSQSTTLVTKTSGIVLYSCFFVFNLVSAILPCKHWQEMPKY